MHETHGKIACSFCQGDETIATELHYFSLQKLRKHQSEKVKGKTRHPTCNFCNRIFENEIKYMQHIKKDHFYCNLCHHTSKKYIFGSLKSYNDHILKLHEEDLKSKKLDLT
mmetsp:Transcript_30140/g.29634  ORF Transcript_30140/g.29634 Transcript_30140/m.29634 type:complete len:111 (-) Transcript_30140:131-463(-)